MGQGAQVAWGGSWGRGGRSLLSFGSLANGVGVWVEGSGSLEPPFNGDRSANS